jgi:hypothetical protein
VCGGAFWYLVARAIHKTHLQEERSVTVIPVGIAHLVISPKVYIVGIVARLNIELSFIWREVANARLKLSCLLANVPSSIFL